MDRDILMVKMKGNNSQIKTNLERENEFLKTDIRPILKEITKIEAKLDKVCLWGIYPYELVINKLGSFSQDKSFNPSEHNNYYTQKFKKIYDKFQINYLTSSRIFREKIECFIAIIPKDGITASEYRDFLYGIWEKLPNLKVSKIEYAIDIFFKRKLSIHFFFGVLKNFLTIPYQRKLWEKKNYEYNGSIYIGRNFIIYERGDDDKRENKRGWREEYINRIRIEHKAKGYKLVKNGISKIKDLIYNAHFLDINGSCYRFEKFSGSDMPPCFDKYPEGTYHNQKRFFQRKIKNLNRKIVGVGIFRELEEKIRLAMKKFDDEWSRNYN